MSSKPAATTMGGSSRSSSSANRAGNAPRVPENTRLLNSYNEYFDVVRADTPDLVEAAFRLRYQVYCVEHPFENPAEHPDGLEHDVHDPQSVHCLLVHRPTGLVAGTVRLVLPQREGSARDLPILAICDHPALSDEAILPRAQTAEISRFAISKEFRRRAEDASGPAGIPGPSVLDARRIIPHITLGLMKAVVRMSHEQHVPHLCAVMEPALLRLLGRFGMSFTPLGPLVDYHGRRQPCYAPLDHLLRGIFECDPEVFDVLTDAGRFHQLSAA
jgi:N-acyl amino acid synthase of PEP-CTERM/exosortase system